MEYIPHIPTMEYIPYIPYKELKVLEQIILENVSGRKEMNLCEIEVCFILSKIALLLTYNSNSFEQKGICIVNVF